MEIEDQNQHSEGCIYSDPDWNYWAKMPVWLPSEAAALLLEIDPDQIPGDLNGLVPTKGSKQYEYFMMHRLLQRACMAEELDDLIPPGSFPGWCQANGIKVPSELRKATKRVFPIVNWRNIARNRSKRVRRLIEELDTLKKQRSNAEGGKEFSPKERKSVSMILYAIAKKNYGYVPGTKNSAANKINTAIGLSCSTELDEGTVKSHLDKAYEAIRNDLKNVDSDRNLRSSQAS